MNNLEKLSPFQYYVMTSFPYIEADFDALTNYELFCKVTDYLNQVITSQNSVIDNFNEIYAAWLTIKAYIDNYFDNLDVQDEINNKLDEMASDGTLIDLMSPYIPTAVSTWLTAHVTPTTPAVDNTLSISGAAADAKVTGDSRFAYRGDFSTLQYTAISSCKLIGFYRFATADIANITDMPSGITTGGIVLIYPNTSTSRFQIVISGGAQYFRYNADNVAGTFKRMPATDTTLTVSGMSADAAAVRSDMFNYRGDFSTLQYTAISQCKNIGFYRFATADISSITDMPSAITSGGIVLVYPNSATTRFQIVTSAEASFFRYNADNVAGTFTRMPVTDLTLSNLGMPADSYSVDLRAMLNRENIIAQYGQTDLNNCTSAGFYNWYQSDISSLSNLPPNTYTGGELIVFRNSADVIWQMAITSTQIAVRYPATGTWHVIYNRTNIRKPMVRWTGTGTGNDGTTDAIWIYYYRQDAGQNTNEDRVTYILGKCENENNDSNVWRMTYVYRVINGTSTRVTRQAEWECAISADSLGYVGGYVHGHEKNPTIKVFLNGTEVNQAAISEATAFDELRIITTSDIYSDGTKLCSHGKEYIFTKDSHKIILRQSLVFSKSATINNCYLCMLPPMKQYFEYYILNSDIKSQALSSLGTDYEVDIPKTTIADIYSGAMHFRGGHGSYWPDNEDIRDPFITDHNSNYHKFYFPACSNTDVAEDDIWISESFYEVV